MLYYDLPRVDILYIYVMFPIQSKVADEYEDSEEGAGKGLADLRDKIRNLQVQVSCIRRKHFLFYPAPS